MTEIVALGEVLIDFTFVGKESENGVALFAQNPGGAPANFLTAAGHLGRSTAIIGKVGADMHGRYLKEVLNQEKIDTSNLIEDESVFTTLAFVSLSESGERTFSFGRKPGADTMLRKEELNQELLCNCKVFHLGSLSLTDEPARSASYEAVDIAKKAGAWISYDPNYRAPLWKNREQAVEQMRGMIPYVDMMKISDEECELLTGSADPKEAASRLLQQGVKLVAVTLGAEGVLLVTKDVQVHVPSKQVPVVDTTGAGDTFWGTFVGAWLEKQVELEQVSEEILRELGTLANLAAGICVQKKGGIPSIPSREELRGSI
jgi:fructokinase